MFMFQEMTEKEKMLFKRGVYIVFFLGIGLLAVIAVFFITVIGKTFTSDASERSQMSVSGEGKIFVKPDIAQFTATIIINASRIGDAQNQNAARSNAVIDFLKKNSVQEKDIKTVNYSVQPQYQYDRNPCPLVTNVQIPCTPVSNPPRIVSYQVRNSLEIKVRDLNKIDDLLQGVVSAGANEVGSVAFTVEDEKAAMAEARKLAIDDAKQKAWVLARDLGVRLKKIISFSESGEVPIYYGRALGASSVLADQAPAPQIEPGEQEIRSNVTITYEFR